MAPDPNMPYSTSNSGGNWNTDYSGQLNEMLAPYQKMAAQLQSPYATMRQDSWLATQHPKIAGVLDAAGLNVAMTPGPQGPEGVGGGISRTFQGLVGAQQYRRQQMIQSAMLPYQMLEPRLRAEDTIAQMQQRGAQAAYEQKRGAWYDARISQMDNPHAQGRSLTDDKGGEWQEIFDPVGGKTRLFNPISQQHADELPPDQQPSFKNSQHQQRISTPGGLAGEIISDQMSPDPAIAARGKTEAGLFANLYGAQAGARKGGEENAPHTYDENKMLLDNEQRHVNSTLPRIQEFKEWEADMNNFAKQLSDPQAYQKYYEDMQSRRQGVLDKFGKYQQSGAWKQGKTYDDWMKNPTATTSEPPSDSGSNWKPK
jgi:hypothetical protein